MQKYLILALFITQFAFAADAPSPTPAPSSPPTVKVDKDKEIADLQNAVRLLQGEWARVSLLFSKEKININIDAATGEYKFSVRGKQYTGKIPALVVPNK